MECEKLNKLTKKVKILKGIIIGIVIIFLIIRSDTTT